MKKPPLLLLFFVMCLSSSHTYSQNDYYWSGGKKIKLEIDSSKIILSAKTGSDLRSIKSNVLLINDVTDISELSVGNFKSFSITVDKKKSLREIYKNISDFSETAFILPSYSNDKIPYYFTNEIILKPKDRISIEQILRLGGNQLIFKERTQYNTYLIEINNAKDLFKAANNIYESGLVEWCHPNFRTKLFKSLTPNDPMYADQYYLNNSGQLGGTANIDINAPQAWDISRGCSDVRIAVIDDGVEAHDDLAGRVLPGFAPLTGGNGAPGVGGAHGQACSGIIAATHDNGIGVSGVAPNSLIVPVNIFVGGETANDIAAAINWAWNPAQGNADIISNSWSYNTTAVVADVIRQAIEDARTNGRVRGGYSFRLHCSFCVRKFKSKLFWCMLSGKC
jgi:serine protease